MNIAYPSQGRQPIRLSAGQNNWDSLIPQLMSVLALASESVYRVCDGGREREERRGGLGDGSKR